MLPGGGGRVKYSPGVGSCKILSGGGGRVKYSPGVGVV